MYDVIIVGGGPAGLSAALMLGRCRRKVLLCDAGHPRNAASPEMHGFLTRDGVNPLELLRLGREELRPYGVEVLEAEVVAARCTQEGENGEEGREETAFEITLEDGRTFASRKLLLATGVRDVLPTFDGSRRFYGFGVHHCPYCDGWEYRDRRLAAYGYGSHAAGLALSLLTWSGHVTLCTGGEALDAEDREQMAQHGIDVREEPVARLEGTGGEPDRLARIVFTEGAPLACDALFFTTAQAQQSELALALGCERKNDAGQIRTRGKQQTEIHGLFVAGDADADVQFVIVAAAEGATAAVAINHELQMENREREEVGEV